MRAYIMHTSLNVYDTHAKYKYEEQWTRKTSKCLEKHSERTKDNDIHTYFLDLGIDIRYGIDRNAWIHTR